MINRSNYQKLQTHLRYLRDVEQIDEKSVSRYEAYLDHLLVWADEQSLAEADRIEPALPVYLANYTKTRGGQSLAPSTVKKIIAVSKRALIWMKESEPTEFRRLSARWINALNPPKMTPQVDEHRFISFDQVQKLITMPVEDGDLATLRDQAAAALLFLSGMRPGAFCTLTLECVDLASGTIKQWPQLGVATKNTKHATMYLMQLPELMAIADRWDRVVRAQLPPTGPWYTPVISQWGAQWLSDAPPGKTRKTALAKQMRKLFAKADVPYLSPHKFRHGHAVYALQHAKTMADYKAISMNLMHNDISTTDGIYAPLAADDVRERLSRLLEPKTNSSSPITDDAISDDELIRKIASLIKSVKLSE